MPMSKSLALRISLALTGAAAFATPAAAQSQVENPGDPWVHVQTGTQFPAKIGALTRQRVTTFTDDGADSGVSYSVEQSDGYMLATVFVYPTIAGSTCDRTFASIDQSIRERSPDATILQAPQAAPSPGGRSQNGRMATYSMTLKGAPVTSMSYLYCEASGKWLVAIRASASEGFEFMPYVHQLGQGIRWPDMLK